MPGAEDIFQGFRNAVTKKVVPYMRSLEFHEVIFNEENQSIAAVFRKDAQKAVFGLSLHHLDYADGIRVSYQSPSGAKYLPGERPVYLFWPDEIDSQFDRILNDFRNVIAPFIS